MNAKKLIILSIGLIGLFLKVQSKMIVPGYSFDDQVRLKLISIENETDSLEFQAYYGNNPSYCTVFPKSTFNFLDNRLSHNDILSRDVLILVCSKGSFLPVFIKDGGLASGQVEDGYQGPFYISMWLEYPEVNESEKIHVRYLIKSGTVGTIGLKIDNKGDYRLVAYDNVKFLID